MAFDTVHFGPNWDIDVQPRSSRTWIVRVTNRGSVASSFLPLGLTLAPDSEITALKTLQLRLVSKVLGRTLSGSVLNSGEFLDYELWVKLEDEDEPSEGESRELALVLSYLELQSLIDPLTPTRLKIRLPLEGGFWSRKKD